LRKFIPGATLKNLKKQSQRKGIQK